MQLGGGGAYTGLGPVAHPAIASEAMIKNNLRIVYLTKYLWGVTSLD